MKKLIFALSLSAFTLMQVAAQTGPAGVGNSSSNLLWLAADNLGLSNNDPVSSWTDASGNANNGSQATGGFQPTFLTSQVNSLPAVSFDGSDDRLDLGTNITSDDITVFAVHSRPSNGAQAMINLEDHIIFTENNKVSHIYSGSGDRNSVAKTNGSYSVYSMHTDNGVASGSLSAYSGTTTNSYTRAALHSNPSSVIGSRLLTVGNYNLFFEGDIAEIIIYDQELNSAQRRIVSAHLGAKYNLTSETSIFSHGSSHGNEVMGIGQESDGSNTSCRGEDSLLVDNASALGNGDYLMLGHNNGTFGTSTSVPGGIVERWNRVWRVDITGTPGTVDIEFFVNGGDFSSPSNYALLIETNDGDFSNGNTSTHVTGRTHDAGANSIKFTGVSLSDGDYFTLAELEADVTATSDGDWNTAGNWSCTCIPGDMDVVTIGNTFDITISGNQAVLDLTIDAGGSLTFSGSDTLEVDGNFTNNGTFSSGTGTIAVVSPNMGQQTFDNGSGSSFSLHNLYVNNTDGVAFNSGAWDLEGNLQVSAGGMDVSGATSFTLNSDASSTSQVLASMSSAFTGTFTVQRHISARNANYANLSVPTTNSTVADIDDDLFISGVGGPDGNATVGGGGTFYSIYRFNNSSQAHENLTATTDALENSRGYEVYLSTSFGSFSATTIDYEGTLKSGSATQLILQGWNLVGNPFHSFISYDDLTKTVFIPDDYYIFNSDNGSYDFFTGGSKPLIAPEQGFWVNKTAPGGNNLVFEEADKGSSTTSAILRKKNTNEDLHFTISSSVNPFKHKMQIHFDQTSTSEKDELDALMLPSPIKTAPAIFSKAINSNDELIRNSLSNTEFSHLIPVSIYTGVEGEYTITADGLDNLYENYSCAYLKDTETDLLIDLTVDPQYQFESNTKGKSDRFSLVVSNSYDDCHELIENGSFVQSFERNLELRNSYNTWFLDYTLDDDISNLEVVVYNMAGQEVVNPSSFSLSGAGSLPLNQLDNLKGIYLIQIRSNDQIINKTVNL